MCPFNVYELGSSLYQVFNTGKVRSFNKNRELNLHTNGKGYLSVSLWDGQRSVRKYIHRLVAEIFIPNPNNYLEVNHIDGDKTNNHYQNLEWCTRQQNVRHAYESGLYDNFMDQVKERQQLWVGLTNSSRKVLDVLPEKNKAGNYKVLVKCNCGNELAMYFNDFKKDKQQYCRSCRPKSSYQRS
jgi:hypothetical protein